MDPARPIRSSADPPGQPTQRRVARELYLRGLGAVLAIAIGSLAVQIRGLVGTRGILPADALLARVAHALPAPTRWLEAPTLTWAWPGDGGLLAVCALGIACGALLVIGTGFEGPILLLGLSAYVSM